MEKIDQILDLIYQKLDDFVSVLKKITSLDLMVKLNELSAKIHSVFILAAAAVILITCFRLYFAFPGIPGYYLLYVIFSPVVILIPAYLSRDFHNACATLISANKTTLSNNAILRFTAIISLLIAPLVILAALGLLFNGDVKSAITMLVYALLLYMGAGTQFNPSLLNIQITNESTSGEDFVTIFSSYLKSFVYFEKILSSLLIFIGVISLIGFMIEPSSLIDLMWYVGYVVAGVTFPILVYLLFTVLWFFNSIILSILSLGKNR